MNNILLQDLYAVFRELNKYFIRMFSIKYFAVSVFHFILTFYTDGLIFVYQNLDAPVFIRIKIIFLIILIFLWQFIGFIIRNYSKSENIRGFIKFSGIYFAVMMLFQLALWPFIVGNQMYYGYLADAVYLTDYAVFQGVFIKYFRIYSLMLVPNIAGITIVQIFVISSIIGYVMQQIKKYFNLGKSVYFFYIPFLFPLMLQYNLNIEKDIIYSYFVLFLIANLLFLKFETNSQRLNLNIFFIALSSALVAAVRPGGIIFFIATPALLYLLYYKSFNFGKILMYFILSILLSVIFVPNVVSTVLLNKNGASYGNVYILNDTFKVLLNEAVDDQNENILEEFESDTNFKIKRILSKKTELNDGFFTNLPKRDKNKFQIISQKLIAEYFDEYVKHKFKKLYYGQVIINLNSNPHNIAEYDNYAHKSYEKIKNRIVQISPAVYSRVIDFFKAYNENMSINHYILKSFIFIYSVIFVISILLGVRKIFIIACYMIFHIVYITLIVPYPGFRFYFPCYITGYLFIFYLIFYFIRRGHINEY